MAQVFMNIYDLTPTETLWNVIDDRKLYKDGKLWLKDDLIIDIKKNGILFSLNVDPEGFIKNGNARYWIARLLLLEGDKRFLYLPVQRNYAAGAFVREIVIKKYPGMKVTDENVKRLMNDITGKIAKHWINYIKDPIEVSKKTFTDFKTDPKDNTFLIDHWKQNLNKWAILTNPNPRNKKTTFVIGIPGKSIGRSRNELTPKELGRILARKKIRLAEMEAKQL